MIKEERAIAPIIGGYHMMTIWDKAVLFLCCTIHLFYYSDRVTPVCVVGFLAAFCAACLFTYWNPDHEQPLAFWEHLPYYLLLMLYLVASFFVTPLCLFLPIILYDALSTQCLLLYPFFVASTLYCLDSVTHGHMLIQCAIAAFAILLYDKTTRIRTLSEDLKHLRDTSVEYNLLLSKKNRDLLEKQDYEVHVATLKERNRIAQEIHDNVGHMLSRSLLQVGALIAINKEDTIGELLSSLKDTLSLAMNNIRESVHDLHDDSIDLNAAITELLADYQKHYHLQFDYDMGTSVPRPLKYCYIAIVKEALSNISKHSNASTIRIIMREHPSFYQLMIEDNGTDIEVSGSGIGLENMQERIDTFHGRFTVTTEHGFRIFISIPKNSQLDGEL